MLSFVFLSLFSQSNQASLESQLKQRALHSSSSRCRRQIESASVFASRRERGVQREKDKRESGILWQTALVQRREASKPRSPAPHLQHVSAPAFHLRCCCGLSQERVMSEAGQGERAKQPVRTCSSSFPLSLTLFSRTGIAHQRPYPCEGIELGRGMDSRRGSRACCCRSDLAFSLETGVGGTRGVTVRRANRNRTAATPKLSQPDPNPSSKRPLITRRET